MVRFVADRWRGKGEGGTEKKDELDRSLVGFITRSIILFFIEQRHESFNLESPLRREYDVFTCKGVGRNTNKTHQRYGCLLFRYSQSSSFEILINAVGITFIHMECAFCIRRMSVSEEIEELNADFKVLIRNGCSLLQLNFNR